MIKKCNIQSRFLIDPFYNVTDTNYLPYHVIDTQSFFMSMRVR